MNWPESSDSKLTSHVWARAAACRSGGRTLKNQSLGTATFPTCSSCTRGTRPSRARAWNWRRGGPWRTA